MELLARIVNLLSDLLVFFGLVFALLLVLLIVAPKTPTNSLLRRLLTGLAARLGIVRDARSDIPVKSSVDSAQRADSMTYTHLSDSQPLRSPDTQPEAPSARARGKHFLGPDTEERTAIGIYRFVAATLAESLSAPKEQLLLLLAHLCEVSSTSVIDELHKAALRVSADSTFGVEDLRKVLLRARLTYSQSAGRWVHTLEMYLAPRTGRQPSRIVAEGPVDWSDIPGNVRERLLEAPAREARVTLAIYPRAGSGASDE
jgi:hypothetical protein